MSRRIVRDRQKKTAYSTPRTFNAQIYDIPDATYCRVLIQGATKPIVAYFSRNFRLRPEGLVIGNAVLCQFKTGNRGYIEVLGQGTVIPTPVPGAPTPVMPTAQDAILTGCQVLAIPPL